MQGGQVVVGRGAGAYRVVGVGAGGDLEHQGGVLYRAGQPAHCIQRPAYGDNAAAGYAPVGGLEADDAVVGGGAQDGADGLGSQGHGADAGGDGYGGAAAGAAGGVVRVPGVKRGGWVKAGKFGGDGFAHHNGAGLFQPGQDGGVIVGDEVGVDLRAGGRRNAGGIENVLDADGYAVEGAGLGQRVEFALALPGVG